MSDQKNFHIVHEGSQWCLKAKSTGKTLGCHPTKEEAEAQERAVQANKHTVTVEDMRKICVPCAEKMESKGMKSFTIDLGQSDLGVEDVPEGVVKKLRAFAVGQTYDIKGVEIFAAGDWNGDTYTEADIKELADNFPATKEYLQPYLKLGHSEDQTLLAEDSLPAAGWISNVYKKGTKLVADFVDMPQKIYDLVKAGAYKRVSSEIFFNVTVNGKQYDKALKAVALLGGETPAVQTLEDIYALYQLSSSVRAYAKEAEVRAYHYDPAQVKEGSMPPELHQPPHPGAVPPHGAPPVGPVHPAVAPPNPAQAHALPPAQPAQPHPEPDGDECMKQLAKAHMDMEAMSAKMAQMAPKQEALAQEAEGYKKELAEARAELKKFKTEAKRKEIQVKVNALIAAKKIVPSQSEALETLLFNASEGEVKKFKVGDKEMDSEALVLHFIESGSGVGLNTAPKSELGNALAVDPENGESVDAAVKKFMAENKGKSYTESYKEVMRKLKESAPKQ